MNQRKLLGFVLVALLAVTAGCSAQASLTMKSVDDVGLAEAASTDISVREPDTERTLVREAIENGSVTTVADRPPVDEALPFRYEGEFYNVSYTETETEPGYRADVRIDYNASSVEGDVVDYGELPAVDRAVVSGLVERADMPEERLQPGYDFGTGQIYNETEADSSVLVTTQEYDAVRYEGEVYPIDVDSETETLTVYRYESELVAESATEYAEELRDEYEFELSGLSDAEREVVDAALNDTNYIDDDDNEGFDSLVDRFRAQQSVVQDDYDGYYVVSYEGRLYWAEMDYGSYAEDGDTPPPPEATPPPET